jgi:pimeloyl-ACP methyl ester carboxylesterase
MVMKGCPVQRQLNPSLIAMLVVLLGSPARPMAQTPPPGPAPGILVDVGGHKLHIRCIGPATGGPTVILEAGGGAFSSVWAPLQDLLAPRVRTCAYDRAGSGWSEPGPAPRTMRQEVFELHSLLDAAKVPGPFILVGHSMGGLLVRLYTEQYGNDVIGVVLVDPTHEDGRFGQMRPGETQPRIVRLREQATGRAIPAPQREGAPSTQYKPEDDYLAEEFQQIHLSRKANPEPLGGRPLIVLLAAKPDPAPPGVSAALWNELRQEKAEQKKDLARLSGNSKLVWDPSSGHQIHRDNPQLVTRAIEEVVEAASKGVRLVP